ncbi:MAG: glycosyltransferase [Anaerolineales bacterium]|nr:glycosyltransferase [Anaerolineales bacterium]
MRIGMMADLYMPHVSGITNYIRLNKKYFEKMGHEVFVFTFGDVGYQDDEPNVTRSPGLPVFETGFSFNLRHTRRARQAIRTMDVVHVHHPFVSGPLALSYCRSPGIPVIFTNHTRYDLYAQAYLPILPGVIGEVAIETYMPTFCRACDMVIAPSPGMRDVLRGFGVDTEIDVIPNGVNLQPYREVIHPVERDELGFSDTDTILIYVGRLGPEKNIPFLLRSFAGAAQAFDNIGLLIVGDGPERDNLEDRVKHMGIDSLVRFPGLIPYHKMPAYLKMADAFVTASVTEVHPLSLIEAMAASLPVLGIQSPGVGDTVENGVTGFLAPEEDLAAFTAKMVRLVTDHKLRREMGLRASQEVNKYAIESTTQVMEERYKQVFSKAKRRKRGVRFQLTRLIGKLRN